MSNDDALRQFADELMRVRQCMVNAESDLTGARGKMLVGFANSDSAEVTLIPAADVLRAAATLLRTLADIQAPEIPTRQLHA